MATAHPTRTRTTEPAGERRTAPTTRTEKGISLARGPALILGTILLAAGLYFLYKAHSFPRFANFPDGTAHQDGKFFIGIFGANGWTGELTAVGGGLLLFGAAHHVLAKTMSLIVGVALGAAAVIAFISGDVLGMAAANHLTELGWAISAVILLFNTLIPRRTRTIEEGAAVGGGAAHESRRERIADDRDGRIADDRGGRMADDRMARDRPAGSGRTASDEPLMARDEAVAGTGAGAGTPAGETAGAETAGGRPVTTDDQMRMRGDRPGRFERSGMARGETAGPDSAMADDGTGTSERTRRFERAGAADEAAGEGTTSGRRRSGGLAGLFRRD